MVQILEIGYMDLYLIFLFENNFLYRVLIQYFLSAYIFKEYFVGECLKNSHMGLILLIKLFIFTFNFLLVLFFIFFIYQTG